MCNTPAFRKLHCVSLILLQLESNLSPGPSESGGRGGDDPDSVGGTKHTWSHGTKERGAESDALIRSALKMQTAPSSSPLPTHPTPRTPPTPTALPSPQRSNLGNHPGPWKGIGLGRAERLQIKGVSRSQTAMKSDPNSPGTSPGCHSDPRACFRPQRLLCSWEHKFSSLTKF